VTPPTPPPMTQAEAWAAFLAAQEQIKQADGLVAAAQQALAHAKSRQSHAYRQEEQAWDVYLRSGR